MHGSSRKGLRRICKPAIPTLSLVPAPDRDNLPEAPDVEEETDIAQTKAPARRQQLRHAF